MGSQDGAGTTPTAQIPYERVTSECFYKRAVTYKFLMIAMRSVLMRL